MLVICNLFLREREGILVENSKAQEVSFTLVFVHGNPGVDLPLLNQVAAGSVAQNSQLYSSSRNLLLN